ncbi:MAG: hypothetical protein ACRDLF_07635 [Solirubrobacteraceae bacterium]
MTIERFVWTIHAEERRTQRLLDRSELERAIRDGHTDREINRGDADWRIYGLLIDGRRFVAVYDHPHGADHTAVRIVSVWDF